MSQNMIPPEIYEIYRPLSNEVSHLHVKWEVFCQLYISGREVIDLLESSAGGFFRVCYDVQARDILLTISRLTDPKQTRVGRNVRDNLTLERLASSIDDPKLKAEIEKLLAEQKNKCGFARDLRNKLIAHNDLSTNLHDRASLVLTATKENVEDALESIRNVMNAVPQYFENSNLATVNYQSVVLPYDGKALIARLREAKKYRTHLKDLNNSF